MNIVPDFIPEGRPNRPGLKLLGPRFITIHSTANTNPGADALAHARYLKSDRAASLPVSWHFTVDDTRIVQHLPLDEIGWHAGDGRDGPGNRSSIGIELCEVGDQVRVEANAAALVTDLLQRFKLPVSAVVQHHHWSGKNCPRTLRSRPGGWEHFIFSIENRLRPAPSVPAPQTSVVGTPIIGEARITVERAQAWARSRNATEEFVALAPLYWRLASERGGVRPEVAYAQAAKETGFGHFRGVVKPDFHNPCGLKTTQGGPNSDPNAHQRFNSWEEGVKAHLDHLALYAGADGYPRQDTPDPRHFSFLHGRATTVEALGGKWAPNPSYGESIVEDYLLPMLAQASPPVPSLQLLSVPDWAQETAQKLLRRGWLRELRGGEDFWRAVVVADRAGVWDRADT